MTRFLQHGATYFESAFARFTSVGNPTTFRRVPIKPKFGVLLIPQDVFSGLFHLWPHNIGVLLIPQVVTGLSHLWPHNLGVRCSPREPPPQSRQMAHG